MYQIFVHVLYLFLCTLSKELLGFCLWREETFGKKLKLERKQPLSEMDISHLHHLFGAKR